MSDLECAQNALVEKLMRRKARNILAIQRNCAVGWLMNACYDVEKSGFSGAIRSDQTGDGAFGDFERRTIDRAESTEMLVQVFDPDQI